MLETALHTGVEHPELLWIVVPSLLSFGAGVAVGLFADAGEETPEPAGVTNER